MSADSVISWAWKQELPSTPKFVLVAFADYARLDPVGYTCFPSVQAIADRCALSVRAVQRAVRNLIACDFMRKVGVHKWGTTIYQLAVDKVCKWVELLPVPHKQRRLFPLVRQASMTNSSDSMTNSPESMTESHPTKKNESILTTTILTTPPNPPQGGERMRRDERKRLRETRVERREIGKLFTEALCNACSTPHPFSHQYFDVQVRHGPCPAFLDSFYAMRAAASSKGAT